MTSATDTLAAQDILFAHLANGNLGRGWTGVMIRGGGEHEFQQHHLDGSGTGISVSNRHTRKSFGSGSVKIVPLEVRFWGRRYNAPVTFSYFTDLAINDRGMLPGDLKDLDRLVKFVTRQGRKETKEYEALAEARKS